MESKSKRNTSKKRPKESHVNPKESHVNHNKDICDLLEELGRNERDVNRDVFKFAAYRKAAATLASLPHRIKSGEEAKKLPGIGGKIAAKIDEFLATGTTIQLQKIRKTDENQCIKELTQVFGVGPAVAKKFFDEGITSIEELKKHPEKLNHHQRIGLKFFKDFEEKIPRNEAQKIESFVKQESLKVDPDLKITLCGSFRRGAEDVGDIDLLVTHEKFKSTSKKKQTFLKQIVEVLEKTGFITDRLSFGDTKFMGVCLLKDCETHRRIDIRFLPIDQFFCGLLYFTGSDFFNQEMRRHANEKGFTLNEYSLRRIGSTGVAGEPLEINSEREIFDYIDFPFREPEERNY